MVSVVVSSKSVFMFDLDELRKAFPKNSKPLPTGVKNIKGKAIKNPKEKMKVTVECFEHRMRKRSVKEDTKKIASINLNCLKKSRELQVYQKSSI